MKTNALVTAALAKVRRLPDGGFEESELIDILAADIVIDVTEERKRRAKEMINYVTKPGSTESVGQLSLPGIKEPYAYEPERIIRNDLGQGIEQKKATPDYKLAEARRASKHAEEATYLARVKNEEAGQFYGWALEQREKGRRRRLEWQPFVTETKIWLK